MPGIKYISFRQYVMEALKNATYEIDNSLKNIPCIVAEAPDLPGCVTQAETFEDARENLIDAVELWIIIGLREAREMPLINGCGLAPALKLAEVQSSSKKEISVARRKSIISS